MRFALRTGALALAAIVVAFPVGAAVLKTADGLSLQADLPASLGGLTLDGKPVSRGAGGLVLVDPLTGQAPAPNRFKLSATARVDGRRIIISGWIRALGDTETVCQLQARVPVGDVGWLFWDDVSRSRPIATGGAYRQEVYPLDCVTSPDRALGIAVGVDPEPVQPTVITYDPALKSLVVNWQLGFSPLAAPSLRMQAPFRFEIYRTAPGWAFRSALAGYYAFHPRQFDWRARYEGLWLFASGSETLPNPQHYAYDEGGPPTTNDRPRGIHTFPYTCTGDLTIAIPPEWGTPKTYEEMLDRLKRWEAIPRVLNWEKLTMFGVDQEVAHSGKWSLKFVADEKTPQQTRQYITPAQKKIDPITVSVWTKAQDVTGSKDPDYSLWLDMEAADGTHDWGKIVPADVGTHDWQQLKIVVGQDHPLQEIRLYLLLRGKHAGTAWWDDVSVTTASAPGKNLVLSPGFESAGPPPEAAYLRANVMTDQNDHMRYYADTWGGADVGPTTPINWLRFVMLVSPDQKPADGQQTEAQKDMARMDAWFQQSPDCAGNYMDGTSAACTTTWEYRRDHLYAFADPLMYQANINRPCGNGMASVCRYVAAYKQRYRGKLAFGNVWASDRMFPVCMALDVPGYESSRWYDLPYADYYRAAAYHKPALYLNYFRIGQQLDTREGGERFFRYATAYGIFPAIGRFTDEAYEKFGDLQHLYIPIVKRLFRAGWEPIPYATTDDPAVRVERFGKGLPMYFTLLNPTDHPRVVALKVQSKSLGLPAGLTATEMSTSASLPLTTAASGVSTRVALGPQDVAVIALMPQQSLAPWYLIRAAEILQGCSYVYASTPPTNAAADLSRQLTAPFNGSPADLARRVQKVIDGINQLTQASSSLPDDLKRRSYRRDLAEAARLLTEALLGASGARIGWSGEQVAPVDGHVTVGPEFLATDGHQQVTGLGYARERLVEVDPAGLTPAAGAPQQPLSLGLDDRTKTSVTVLATISFRDAAMQMHELQRRGYAYFGAISELSASYEPATSTIGVRLRNADVRPRQFDLALEAPSGLQLEPATGAISLTPGESRAVPVRVAFAPDLPSGEYAVRVTAKLPGGLMTDDLQVKVQYVTPLQPGDLALASTGAQVAVDSVYYAYSEKPLNDGVVLPTGAFNEGAWAAAEAEQDHWIQITWPAPQTIGRVQVYWNVEDGVTWTGRQVRVEAKQDGQWVKVAEASPAGPEPVTTLSLAPVTTAALRLVQPKGMGPEKRPNIMWVREVAVYAP